MFDADNEVNRLKGGKRIYTDEFEITEKNVIKVLQDTMIAHVSNVQNIKFLIDYEMGEQPLKREKTIRKDINVVVCDNLSNEIVEFKMGYNWANPITYIQRGDYDKSKNDPKVDDKGILELNEMLESECAPATDLETFRFMEITGIGYQFVDVKREYDGGSVFDLVNLNPMTTYIIYDRSVKHNKLASVSYRIASNGDTYFTVITPTERFEILNGTKIVKGEKKETWVFGPRSGEMNPIGMVPVVEFIRSSDRTGCFERQITDMDNLNILTSDFTNNVAQDTQTMWWGNDFEFPVDSTTGKPKAPVSGQWVMTFSGEGKNPKIQPLVMSTQYDGILSNIKYRRDVIKQKCSVPNQTDNNRGSTGTAMSMSSGWQNAEVAASKEARFVERSKVEVAKLILKAIQVSPDTPSDSPLLKLNISDIKPSVVRNRTYDLATKANTFATWVSHGVHPRHALQQVEAFPDTNLVYEDSIPYIKKYIDSEFKKEQKQPNNQMNQQQKLQSDTSDQTSTSPILDGMKTGKAEEGDDK